MGQDFGEPASHCPATKAADILGDKWVLLILRAMILGARRYSDFSGAIPRISPSVLSGRLKQLCEQGLIVRRGEAGQQATYRLAPSGREAEPIIVFMAEWGLKWAQRHTSVDQLDVGGTMWDLHKTLDTTELPDGETVFSFKFNDLDKHDRWWIVASHREVDLCDADPGKSVDLYLNGSIETVIDVWMGQRELDEVLRAEEVILTGEPLLTDTAKHWFPLSPVARAKKQEGGIAAALGLVN